MAWGNYKESGSSGERRKWLEEGNIEVLLIPQEKLKVKLLLENITPEDWAQAQGVSVEQAQEELNTKVAEQRWIRPISIWEHQIPSIPNQRFFSTAQCAGRNNCHLCMRNAEAEEKAGMALENRAKPYPIRKKYLAPAWVYDWEKVLFIRQNEQYFDDLGAIIDQFGTETDILVYKEGQGMRTSYKAMYAGKSTLEGTIDVPVMPKDVTLVPDAAELARRTGEGGQGGHSPSAPVQSGAPSTPPPAQGNVHQPQDPGKFLVPFGQYKGQDLEHIAQTNRQYLDFLSKSSSGPVKAAVDAYLATLA